MASSIDKLTQAKAKLVMKHPFFAHIVLRADLVEAPIETMATDMVRIYYGEKFVQEHSISELTGVLAHEALHIAFMHGLRCGPRNPRVWNWAADYAINPIVLDAGMMLPPGGLHKDEYRNLSAQEIYEDLIKNMTTIEIDLDGGSGDGSGKDGTPGDMTGPDGKPLWGGVMKARKIDAAGNAQPLSADELSTLESEIKIVVQQAAEAAKSVGKLPGGLEGLIKAIAAPKIDWKDYIQNWIKGITPDNYTWQRPNRTMLANHRVYMPRMQLNGAGTGILSIDTSGSVSDNELIEYINEIVGVIDMVKPDKLIIVQHDAIIQKVDIWEAGQDFRELKIKGRGGTCIMPSFNFAANYEDDVDWMICFTDMGICDYPKGAQVPDFPVLWAATGPNNVDFGTYIPLRDAMDRV